MTNIRANLLLLVCLVAQLTFVSAGTFVQPKSQNKTLVIVDTWATLETHSIFFDHIQKMGAGNHTLEYKLISGMSTDKVNFEQFNKYFYDNIILMAPTVQSIASDLVIKDILKFVDFHHNFMMFASSESRGIQRRIANEFGMDFEDYGYTMQGGSQPDHASVMAGKHQNVSWSKNIFEPLYKNQQIFSKLDRPVLYEDGLGAILDSQTNNEHVFPILRADQGAFSYNPSAPDRKEVGLVSGN